MFTRDVCFEGFTTADWARLGDVLRPRAPARVRFEQEPAAGGVEGGVIAVTTGQRLRKLLSTRSGRLPLSGEPWPESLERLAGRHGARWALELHTGALEELMDRFGERLRPEHDSLEQILCIVTILRELEAEGLLAAWPWRLSQWPVPTQRILFRALDALCPTGKVILLGVFDRGEVATCLAARRRDTGFDYLLGPEELRRQMGLLSGDWTRDYRHLARAVEHRLGPLAVGCFGEYETFQRLANDPRPGVWAEAVAARDVILSPVVSALAIPLGIDVGRAALATVRSLTERIGARSWLGPDSPLLPALDRVERLPIFERDLRRVLGFDPIVVLRKLLARDPGDG
jgi:hypothetical protein